VIGLSAGMALARMLANGNEKGVGRTILVGPAAEYAPEAEETCNGGSAGPRTRAR